MPIAIVCPGCHARFSVSEKFAGKQGPCPKCKKTLTIPKLEEQVVIHAPPADAGTKDKTGRPLLKPTVKSDAKFNPVVAVIVAVVSLGAFAMAFVLRSAAAAQHGVPLWAAVAALLIIGPLLVAAGYWFLRDDEFEPFRGSEFYARMGAVALLYAALWGAFYFTYPMLSGLAEIPETKPEMYQWLYIGPIFVGAGTLIAWGALQLEWGNAFLHFAFYLFVLMLLRIAMGLSGAWEFHYEAPKTDVVAPVR